MGRKTILILHYTSILETFGSTANKHSNILDTEANTEITSEYCVFINNF